MEMYLLVVGLIIGVFIGVFIPIIIAHKEDTQEMNAMKCPKCQGAIRVTDTVSTPLCEVYRRRKCVECDHTFFTVEFEVEQNEKFMKEWRENHRNW